MVPDDEETNDTEGFQSYQEHKIVAREIQKNELQIAKHELIDKKVCKNVISGNHLFRVQLLKCNFYILKFNFSRLALSSFMMSINCGTSMLKRKSVGS